MKSTTQHYLVYLVAQNMQMVLSIQILGQTYPQRVPEFEGRSLLIRKKAQVKKV
jgi:hypothetical protein